jgi:predicted nuclease of predicted toxin-antitoxin system
VKILFDHCVPKPLRQAFPAHEVRTAAQMGWAELRNGALLAVAATAFDVVLTVDKNIKFQQNLHTFPISVIVLDAEMNTPEVLRPFAPYVEAVLPTLRPGQIVEIDKSGKVTVINEDRNRQTDM